MPETASARSQFINVLRWIGVATLPLPAYLLTTVLLCYFNMSGFERYCSGALLAIIGRLLILFANCAGGAVLAWTSYALAPKGKSTAAIVMGSVGGTIAATSLLQNLLGGSFLNAVTNAAVIFGIVLTCVDLHRADRKPQQAEPSAEPGQPEPNKAAVVRDIHVNFPEITWKTMPRWSRRTWAYDPDRKRARVRDGDPAAALRAAGAHADIAHLGDASGLMLARAAAMDALGRRAAADSVRRAAAELRDLGAPYAGPLAEDLSLRRAGFAEAFARAIEDPAALRRDAPAAARYIDACIAEAPAALGRRLTLLRDAFAPPPPPPPPPRSDIRVNRRAPSPPPPQPAAQPSLPLEFPAYVHPQTVPLRKAMPGGTPDKNGEKR